MANKLETILCDIEDQIMIITLHRPDAMNTFNMKMCDELCAAFKAADDDDNVRAVILTGSGNTFCAGADLSMGSDAFERMAQSESGQPMTQRRDFGGVLTLAMYNSKKPIIAACNGAAVGVGATMQIAADIRIAAQSAKYGFVFARRGVTMESCGSYFLPRIVGISQAMEWVATGRIFDAQEALTGRLVSQVVPDDQLLDAAKKIAREIADNTSAVSVTLCKALLWKMLDADHPIEASRIESKLFIAMAQSPDVIEGITSFFEKRKANFPMKVSQDMPEDYPWWQDEDF